MKKSLQLLLFKPISSGATYLIKNETIKSALTLFCIGWITVRGLYLINGIHVKAWQSIHISYLDTFVGFNLSSYLIDFTYRLFLSILIAFICWIVMRIWVKVDFLKVFMVTLVISALNFFVTIPNILVFNLVKKLSIDSPFWGKTIYDVNDTLRMYKNDDIRMYNFNCITDTIVEVITTCNTYTLLTGHLL